MSAQKRISKPLKQQSPEMEELRAQLAEANETLRAIREGEVDAVIVSGSKGEQVFSLVGAESIYRLIVETMKEAAFTVTFDGRVLYCNSQFGEFVKYPINQILGHHLNEFIDPAYRSAADALLVMARERSVRQRLVFASSDGRLVPAHISADALNQPDGPSICVVATNLTELENSTEMIQQLRRQQEALQAANEELAATEEELRVQNEEIAASRLELDRTRARYQDLFETAPDGYIGTDAEGIIQEVNGVASRMFGRTAAELKGNPFSALLPISAREAYLELLTCMTAGEASLPKWELEMHLPGRPSFWASVKAAASRSDEGNIIGLRWLIRDVTGRKTAEFALRESEEKFRSLFESTPDAVFLTIHDGSFVAANPAACAMFGRTEQELCTLGRHGILDLNDPHLSAAINELQRTGRIQRRELTAIRRNGEKFPVEVDSVILPGEPVRFFVTMRDITDRRRVEEELAAAKQFAESAQAAAESANRAKDHFLAVLSHELRTPLTPVMMGVSILQDRPDLDAKARETLEMVRSNVEMEARLIDDLLDVTRIARGKVELNRIPVDLCTVIQRAVEVCKPDIETRRLHFGLDPGEASPYWVEGDVSRLQQVFWNLLKNAIKFTPHGGCVGIRCRPSDDQVLIEISDSGIGIEPEALPRVFDAFEQVERSVTQQFGGLGLGLAISKALVDLHGGAIEAHSEGRNKGATFRIRLPLSAPLRQPDAPASSASTQPTVSSLRILLVEDHGVTAKLIQMVLTEQGHKVEIAGDMATALDLAGRHAFDLLLSDLGLPDGSGHDLMRELHARGHKFPAIALSGWGREADIHRSHQAGFATHLTKPVSREAMMEAVASAVVGDRHTSPNFSASEQADVPLFDADAALKRCFGKREMFEEMVNFFEKDSTEQLNKMRIGLSKGDFAEIGRAAHRIKGSLVYLGAQPAVDAAGNLEQAAKSGDLTSASKATSELEHQILKLKKALASEKPGS